MAALLTDVGLIFSAGVNMLNTFSAGTVNVVYLTLAGFTGTIALSLFGYAKSIIFGR